MTAPIRIAVDVMGGDHGAQVTIPGAEIALSRHKDAEVLLFGKETEIEPLLAAAPRVKARGTIRHAEAVVRMDDKPSQALRTGRWRSSMWLALDAVKTGAADVAVSAGNTGALMAMAKFNLRMMSGIERPAIAAIWPTLRGESIVLDVGASIGAEAQQLVDNAVMGGAMARALFDLERPTVALLNIGVEEVKGLEEVRSAGAMLKEMSLPGIEYCGFVEGDGIGSGAVDVVVTEAFGGNIALKTGEGTARQIASYLRSALSQTWRSRLGAWLARSAFDTLREKMDPRRMNGGVFLGLNGIVIKSHGGTDAEGFASALDLGYDMVKSGLLAKIKDDLAHYRGGKRAEPGALSRAEAS